MSNGVLMMGRKCSHPDCFEPAGMYGVCRHHEAAHIESWYSKAVRAGVVEDKAPACFAGKQEWKEYVVAWLMAGRQSENRGKRVGVSYCRDCTVAFKAQMMEEGRCQHPETVFIRADRGMGDVIGVAIDRPGRTQAWESAIMGASGEVVKLPPEEHLTRTLRQMELDAAPKKRGPKSKKDHLSA